MGTSMNGMITVTDAEHRALLMEVAERIACVGAEWQAADEGYDHYPEGAAQLRGQLKAGAEEVLIPPPIAREVFSMIAEAIEMSARACVELECGAEFGEIARYIAKLAPLLVALEHRCPVAQSTV